MQLRQITTDVFHVEGIASNWTLLKDGRNLTLIDAGYPKDIDGIAASVEQLGLRLEDIRGVLITHAHVDHVGGIPALQRLHPIPAYAHENELPALRGERREQATTRDVVSRCWRPRVALWALTIARAGAQTEIRLPGTRAIPTGSAIDLPGSPVAVPCAGHTSGHTAYLVPRAGVVVTGDALVTGHPIVARQGPQLLPEFFSHDPAQAAAALDAFTTLDADHVLPGHGRAWIGPVRSMVNIVPRRRPSKG